MGLPTRTGRPAPRRRTLLTVLAAAILPGLVAFPIAAHAMVPPGWVHDHSPAGIPKRPHGYTALVNTFGQPCSDAANDARSYWPSQAARGVPGYITYHPYIDRDVSYNIRNHIDADGMDNAVDYGVYGYDCRYVSGSTSWSVHAFGGAIDTNSARNPQGQTKWDGHGADGVAYHSYLPGIWKGPFPGHNFYWGKNFSTNPDPMHFQYVTGY
ncbi:MAG: M15 family metallopeptidase [Actinomycetota bacterium]